MRPVHYFSAVLWNNLNSEDSKSFRTSLASANSTTKYFVGRKITTYILLQTFLKAENFNTSFSRENVQDLSITLISPNCTSFAFLSF
jgi:hypothetical protein